MELLSIDGLFEDLDLCAMANSGAVGLEYILRDRYPSKDSECQLKVEEMLKKASQLCALLLRSLKVHKIHDQRTGISASQIDDFERAKRFLHAGWKIEDFDPRSWSYQAKEFRKSIRNLLSGKASLSKQAVMEYQEFLNATSSILLESVHSQQQIFMDERGIHYIELH